MWGMIINILPSTQINVEMGFDFLQVQDVAKTLGAKLLYEVEDEEIAMSTEVDNYLVATLQLSDLLNYLPHHVDPTKGSVVITSASRVDILLGMIHLHESKADTNIAAVVLTGGNPPPKEVHELLKVWIYPINIVDRR